MLSKTLWPFLPNTFAKSLVKAAPAKNQVPTCVGQESSLDCGEVPTLVPGEASPPCPLQPWQLQGFFWQCFSLTPHHFCGVLLFLKYAFIQVLPPWPRGWLWPAVGPVGWVGTGCVSPGLSSQWLLPTDTWYTGGLGTFLGTFLILANKILPRAK